jgi:hypothetical protein
MLRTRQRGLDGDGLEMSGWRAVKRLCHEPHISEVTKGESVMSEFTYLFRGRDVSASPEQMQKTMQKWLAWFKDLGAKGHLKDPGHPLEHTGKVVSGKQKAVSDGPYAEAKDVVGGYIVVEASDLNQAVELSTGCPILEVGGSVEVRPNQKINS